MNLEHVDFLAYKQFDKARNSRTSDKKVHLDNIPKIGKKPARKLISDFMEFSQKSKIQISKAQKEKLFQNDYFRPK